MSQNMNKLSTNRMQSFRPVFPKSVPGGTPTEQSTFSNSS